MRVLPVIAVTATVLSLSAPLSLPAAQGVYGPLAEIAPFNQEVYGPLAEIAPFNQEVYGLHASDLVTTYEQDPETQIVNKTSDLDALVVKQEMSRRALGKT